MPLFRHKNLNNNIQLAIWKVTEPSSWFENQFVLNKVEQGKLAEITFEGRRQQWLATRLLLSIVSGSSDLIITNDTQRKPCLNSENYNISITHTSNFVAILFGTENHLGIDIESIKERIIKISHKFISEEEFKFIDKKQNYLEQLNVIWSAKEAMFKYYSKGNLDFRKHLFVEPFNYEKKGMIKGKVINHDFHQSLNLSYEQIEDHILVYTYPSL